MVSPRTAGTTIGELHCFLFYDLPTICELLELLGSGQPEGTLPPPRPPQTEAPAFWKMKS